MGMMIEEQAVIDCLTNTAKYYEREDADEWTKGIHYGLLHGVDNILDNVPTVEAIPKDQYEQRLKENNELINDLEELRTMINKFAESYENRLKADMVAMLTEIQLEFEENTVRWYMGRVDGKSDDVVLMETINDIIQQKINALKAENKMN